MVTPSVPVFNFDPELFRAHIYSNVASQRIRWWRAYPDSTYDRDSGIGPIRFRVEQTAARDYRALMTGAEFNRDLVQLGQIVSGEVVVTTMPDELPLATGDWIAPLGRIDRGIDAQSFPYRQTLKRGGKYVTQAGLVASSSTAVTGSGTAFLTAVRAGDVIRATGQELRVVSVSSDTNLVVESAPSPAWSGVDWQKGTEYLTFYPVAAIDDARTDATTYAPADLAFTADGAVQWLSATNSPAAGATYGISYRFYPRYEVVRTLGKHMRPVYGHAMPQRVVASQAEQQSYAR